MASTPALAACSAILADRSVVGEPTCMMFFILPLAWSAAISAMRMFSASSRRTLSPVPPATQKPWAPCWMLNSITSLKAASFSPPSCVMGVRKAGYTPRNSDIDSPPGMVLGRP